MPEETFTWMKSGIGITRNSSSSGIQKYFIGFQPTIASTRPEITTIRPICEIVKTVASSPYQPMKMPARTTSTPAQAPLKRHGGQFIALLPDQEGGNQRNDVGVAVLVLATPVAKHVLDAGAEDENACGERQQTRNPGLRRNPVQRRRDSTYDHPLWQSSFPAACAQITACQTRRQHKQC